MTYSDSYRSKEDAMQAAKEKAENSLKSGNNTAYDYVVLEMVGVTNFSAGITEITT